MRTKPNSALPYLRRRVLIFTKVFVFLSFTTVFGFTPNDVEGGKMLNKAKTVQQQVTGVVTDADGNPLPGASIVEKGTVNGTQTDFDGNYTISVPDGATLVFTYIGFATKEIAISNQTNLNVTLEEDTSILDEVVVVGYGTQKKVNLTAAVSQVGAEVFQNRPTANAFRSLQGTVPGLQITNSSSGGEPGAPSNINIRGFITTDLTENSGISNAGPLVLIDGIEQSLNDIDPEDIESVSVLKDAAAASIYGSRAAGGAVLVITKSGKNSNGKMRVNYSTSVSFTKPTRWPKNASPINFAYAVNDARINNNQNPYHDETDLANILANMENPGSAPSITANAANTNWSYTSIGIDATGATDWEEVILKKWAQRTKHNLSLSGGTEELNYYLSVGAYDEDGLLKVGDESFERYNVDAKISAKPKDWLTLELFTKLRKSNSDFPIASAGDTNARNKSRALDLISKLKPGIPLVDPIYGSGQLQHNYFMFWDTQRSTTDNDQLVLLPRIIIEPIKNLKFNANLNYRRDNNTLESSILSNQVIRPQGLITAPVQASTFYGVTLQDQEYFSPNLFATYNTSFGNHNIDVLAGYQSEVNKFHSLNGQTDFLITNNIVSLNASLDDLQEVNETRTHWATQSVFSRFRYNYKEKYLLEFSYRRDGSSRFEPDNRWSGFPSYSAGYNVAREDFWPIDAIQTFKLRGSYGTLGNQNVPLNQYLSTIDINSPGGSFLFNGQQEVSSDTPDLVTQNLTWETVKTTDIGFDLQAFNKLDVAFSWYRTDIEGIAAQGLDLPSQLGTSAALTNIGTSRVEGWEVEASWRQQFGDFGFSIRGVLSDYQRTMVEYPNETGSLAQPFYEGQDLGEIWGLQWDGWFQTDDEYATYPVDQSFVAGNFWAGDTKYKDLNGDGVIDRGEFVEGDTGDWDIIGNSTPRYQYSATLAMNYKNFDFNMLVQGVGKRDVLLSNHQRFRGPGQGPFHINVWEEHLDYFRAADTESPLGPNTDAYFPAPYTANPGNNNRNYRYAVDRYIQNGAYARLKSLQIGYTIPRETTEKFGINTIRLFATGENLITIDDLLFFDPEIVTAGTFGSAQSYPLSKIVSLGLNVSF
nr:TonB-dependent receptor [uncultured Allomuricauda sp.]